MPSQGNETKAELEAMHTPGKIRARLSERQRLSYLSDFIYGAIDGAVTTFAVVSAVAGAALASHIVIILGVANLVADGFSMAAANFLGTRAENQQRDQARREEEHEIETHPEGEREEIRQIFSNKGFSGETLDEIVNVITSDRKRWVDTMLAEEHGLSSQPRSAGRAAVYTLIAFIIIGAIPLIPYLVSIGRTVDPNCMFIYSIVMTGAAFFIVGALKSRFVEQKWWLAGLETLGVGGIASGIAYIFGMLLKGVAENGGL